MRNIMPAQAPSISDQVAAGLRVLGERVRAHREQQKVSATAAAEAAGMSRVTLHRIERGEPSVTMGAYLSAIDALGLQLDLVDPRAPKTADPSPASLPASVRLDDYPQLKRLAWQLPGATGLTAAEALSLYERNWRHIDVAGLEPAERALVQLLADQLGGGRLLV
jgi:transcriptional regulator with XRE-family HTH domain